LGPFLSCWCCIARECLRASRGPSRIVAAVM
jgi:hypothetical protein